MSFQEKSAEMVLNWLLESCYMIYMKAVSGGQTLEILLPSHVSLPGFHNTNLRPSGELFLQLNRKHFSCPYKMTMRMFRFSYKNTGTCVNGRSFLNVAAGRKRLEEVRKHNRKHSVCEDSRKCYVCSRMSGKCVWELSCLWGFSFASASGLPIQTENGWSSLLNCSTIMTMFLCIPGRLS